MTKEQLLDLVSVEELLVTKQAVLQDLFQIRNQLMLLRNLLTEAGTIKPPREHFSPAAFAKKIGISPSQVAYWIELGIIKASQNGPFGSWKIPVSEVERIISE